MKNKLIKFITLFTTFAVGITLAVNHNVNPVKAETVTYDFNYDPYTYSGSFYSDKEIDFNATGGMNGELRTTLRSKLTPEAFYTYYKQGETHLATQLQYCDEDPTNKNNMVYFYTRDSVAKNPATTWNREHVWCQSRSNGNWGTEEGGVDLLHLRPTYNVANSTRNNFPYGDTNHTNPKTTEGCFYGYLVNGYFEPLDCVKGDVARIIMYVWTIYDGYKNYSSLSIPNIIRDYDTLLRWHTLDKPDVLEGNRNDYVQTSRQKNRNPYVDHPELAWKIFGDQASTSVKNSCMEAYPANGGGSGQTIDPTGISLNKTTASVGAGKTLQLRATLQPTGASGTVTWSSNNTTVATVDSNGLVTAKTAGQATITATVGTYSATCVITVTAAVINYGTLENPISVADAIEIIDAAGGSSTAQPMYVRGVVSSNEAYSTQYNNYNRLWLKNNANNVAESFQFYRATTSSSISSTYSDENSLTDLEIVGYGYGQKYNNNYEISKINNVTPQILSVSNPSATGIELNSYEEEINVGETVTLTATVTPSNTDDVVTWESLDEDIATVNSNGVVTGVSEGTTIITARANEDVEADCVVTVNGTGETSLVIADSISIGDTVYLGCSATSAQYNGPSGTTQDAYGTYVDYVETPDTDVYPLTVCDGNADDSFAFKITTGDHANKYLGWSGSKNSLKVTSTLDDNSSWAVSIDSDGNAEISNIATPERVIWWNASSPRFACYTGKTAGDGYKNVQLWKVVSVIPHVETPADYIDKTTSLASISGRTTNSGSQNTTDSIVFANLDLDPNGNIQYLDPFVEGGLSVTFAGGSNDGKYYSTGSGIRTYGGGTITISATGLISSITFVWGTTYKPSDASVVSTGAYNVSTGVWTGSATSVTLTRPSGSGHWRLQSVSATYLASSITVDNVAMRFGASISIEDWTTIDETWGVDDFGVICVKKTTMDSYKTAYDINTVKDAFLQGKNVTKLGNKNNLEHPYPVGDNYVFTVRIGVSDPNNYLMEVRAVPYIQAGGQYYFFDEIDPYSVKTLAQHYLDNPSLECALPNAALRVLAAATAQGGN